MHLWAFELKSIFFSELFFRVMKHELNNVPFGSSHDMAHLRSKSFSGVERFSVPIRVKMKQEQK